MNEHELIRAFTRRILEQPHVQGEWTLQGFGMLRLYLRDDLRFHVWDSRYRNPGVSETHTHPWNFHSYVVAGRVLNTRYVETDEAGATLTARRQTILCGAGGGLEGGPEDVFLAERPTEIVEEGESYTQQADEIHVSRPEDGTVTIIEREFLGDADHAYVYFDGDWVTAEPRKATTDEVRSVTRLALERWFA